MPFGIYVAQVLLAQLIVHNLFILSLCLSVLFSEQ